MQVLLFDYETLESGIEKHIMILSLFKTNGIYYKSLTQ